MGDATKQQTLHSWWRPDPKPSPAPTAAPRAPGDESRPVRNPFRPSNGAKADPPHAQKRPADPPVRATAPNPPEPRVTAPVQRTAKADYEVDDDDVLAAAAMALEGEIEMDARENAPPAIPAAAPALSAAQRESEPRARGNPYKNPYKGSSQIDAFTGGTSHAHSGTGSVAGGPHGRTGGKAASVGGASSAHSGSAHSQAKSGSFFGDMQGAKTGKSTTAENKASARSGSAQSQARQGDSEGQDVKPSKRGKGDEGGRGASVRCVSVACEGGYLDNATRASLGLPTYDEATVGDWIYPTNYPVRDYQLNIVRRALFKNTLVTLPTGLGKTFIAAVVMYNFYRWFPDGKIVFLAPTKPLVAQQIDACVNVMAIPRSVTAEMTGTKTPSLRSEIWESKRVFFLTPQVVQNDLNRGTCPAKRIVCVVVDEAHKALGNHAYCAVVNELAQQGSRFRVLALSATPGDVVQTVQEVLSNLMISAIELRGEDALDIRPYVHGRKLEVVTVPLGERVLVAKKALAGVLSGILGRLCNAKAFYERDPEKAHRFALLKQREKYRANPPDGGRYIGQVEGDFAVAISLAHSFELLQQHGLASFFQQVRPIVQGKKEGSGRARSELTRCAEFMEVYRALEAEYGGGDAGGAGMDAKGEAKSEPDAEGPAEGGAVNASHPKVQKLLDIVLEHFVLAADRGEGESTRVMVFSQYRDSVHEIVGVLAQHRPLIRPMAFVGQSSRGSKGLTQKEQMEVVRQFRAGGHNTLVATCVGEEGLDIGDVDLIVCFDAQTSAVRLVQRMGRTGRKRDGRIVMLVAEGKEERLYKKGQSTRKSIHNAILSGQGTFTLCADHPVLPEGCKPEMRMEEMAPPPAETPLADRRRKTSAGNGKASAYSRRSKGKQRAEGGAGEHSGPFSFSEERGRGDGSDGFLTADEHAYYLAKYAIDGGLGPYEGWRCDLSTVASWQSVPMPVRVASHSIGSRALIEACRMAEDAEMSGRVCASYEAEMSAHLDPRDVMQHPSEQALLQEARRERAASPRPVEISDDEDFARRATARERSSRRSPIKPVVFDDSAFVAEASDDELERDWMKPTAAANKVSARADVHTRQPVPSGAARNAPRDSAPAHTKASVPKTVAGNFGERTRPVEFDTDFHMGNAIIDVDAPAETPASQPTETAENPWLARFAEFLPDDGGDDDDADMGAPMSHSFTATTYSHSGPLSSGAGTLQQWSIPSPSDPSACESALSAHAHSSEIAAVDTGVRQRSEADETAMSDRGELDRIGSRTERDSATHNNPMARNAGVRQGSHTVADAHAAKRLAAFEWEPRQPNSPVAMPAATNTRAVGAEERQGTASSVEPHVSRALAVDVVASEAVSAGVDAAPIPRTNPYRSSKLSLKNKSPQTVRVQGTASGDPSMRSQSVPAQPPSAPVRPPVVPGGSVPTSAQQLKVESALPTGESQAKPASAEHAPSSNETPLRRRRAHRRNALTSPLEGEGDEVGAGDAAHAPAIGSGGSADAVGAKRLRRTRRRAELSESEVEGEKETSRDSKRPKSASAASAARKASAIDDDEDDDFEQPKADRAAAVAPRRTQTAKRKRGSDGRARPGDSESDRGDSPPKVRRTAHAQKGRKGFLDDEADVSADSGGVSSDDSDGSHLDEYEACSFIDDGTQSRSQSQAESQPRGAPKGEGAEDMVSPSSMMAMYQRSLLSPGVNPLFRSAPECAAGATKYRLGRLTRCASSDLEGEAEEVHGMVGDERELDGSSEEESEDCAESEEVMGNRGKAAARGSPAFARTAAPPRMRRTRESDSEEEAAAGVGVRRKSQRRAVLSQDDSVVAAERSSGPAREAVSGKHPHPRDSGQQSASAYAMPVVSGTEFSVNVDDLLAMVSDAEDEEEVNTVAPISTLPQVAARAPLSVATTAAVPASATKAVAESGDTSAFSLRAADIELSDDDNSGGEFAPASKRPLQPTQVVPAADRSLNVQSLPAAAVGATHAGDGGRIVILADTRQVMASQALSVLRSQHGMRTVIPATGLRTCDYIVSQRTAVLRRTQQDLVNAVTSTQQPGATATAVLSPGARLYEQAVAMRSQFERRFLIVEKTVKAKGTGGIADKGLSGRHYETALAAVTRLGLTVMCSEDKDETASILATIARAEADHGFAIPESLVDKKVDEQMLRFLLSVPCVSYTTALNIMLSAGFENLAAVLNCPAEQLVQRTPFMTEATAREMQRYFETQCDASMVSRK